MYFKHERLQDVYSNYISDILPNNFKVKQWWCFGKDENKLLKSTSGGIASDSYEESRNVSRGCIDC